MKKVLIVCSVALIFFGCYTDKEEELYPNSDCDIANVTYANNIKQLVENRCATSGCHVAGATLPDLSDYNKLKQNIDRVKVRAIDLKTMPQGAPLNKCETDKLAKWISEGAINN